MLVDARIELHPALQAPRTRAKDLLFLDIALESCFKTAIDKRLISLNFNNPPVSSVSLFDNIYFFVLENMSF